MCVIDSVTTLTEKTTIYSTLVGILNARQYNFGEEVNNIYIGTLCAYIFTRKRRQITPQHSLKYNLQVKHTITKHLIALSQ